MKQMPEAILPSCCEPDCAGPNVQQWEIYRLHGSEEREIDDGGAKTRVMVCSLCQCKDPRRVEARYLLCRVQGYCCGGHVLPDV